MLKIISEIKKYGLNEIIKKYNLTARDYGHKILLKYSQIESDMSEASVQDARGLILKKETWQIMCLTFRKFFNAGEKNAATIDWSTALVLEKLDGTLIQLYWDWVLNEWCVGTTGTADGSGEVNNKFGTKFSDLFWSTIAKNSTLFKNVDKMTNSERTQHLNKFLDTNLCYAFELTTPYNIVVKPHSVSSVTLLAVRNLKTLQEKNFSELSEIARQIDVPLVKAYNFKNLNAEQLAKTLENLPYTEEGYVVVDANFNRIKIKNPAYVAVHHLKSKTAEHAVMEIIKSNEVEEYIATFPERSAEVLMLKENYDKFKNNLHNAWESLKQYLPKDQSKEEQKKYALTVFKITESMNLKNHSGLFFMLKDGKIKTINEYLISFDNKKLYNLLK